MPFETVRGLYLHTVIEHYVSGWHSVLPLVNAHDVLEPRQRTVHQQMLVEQGKVELVYEVESDSDGETNRDADVAKGGNGGDEEEPISTLMSIFKFPRLITANDSYQF